MKIIVALIALTTLMANNNAVAGGNSVGGAVVQAGSYAGAAINAHEGYQNIPPCVAKPPDVWACIKAVAFFAQAATDIGAGGAAGSTKSGFQSGASYGAADWGGDVSAANVEQLKLQVNNGLEELAKQGYKVDLKNDKLTTPNGKSADLKSLGSAAALAKAGLISESDVPAVEKDLADMGKKFADKYKVVPVGVAGGGGGGYGGSSYRSTASVGDPYGDYLRSLNQPRAASAAGMTRTLAGGEAIGAQADNIFDMIRRSYDRKAKEKIFIGQ